MEEKKDLKNLTEIVDFGLDLVALGMDVAKDKKVDLADLGLLMGKMPQLVSGGIAAFSDLEHLPLELEDMSEEEATALVTHVMSKLTVDDAKARLIVEKSLKASASVYGLVKAILS